MTSTDIPSNAPRPRQCHISKWSDFDGYGFNLHADKTRPGQYIGKVDADSPASVAGLLEGDRIIEVNGVNISNENHKQVVQRIKNIANETKLLVVDSETDKWYKEHNIVVFGDQSNILQGTSERTSSTENVNNTTTNGLGSTKSEDEHSAKSEDGHSGKAEEDGQSVGSVQSSSHSESSTQPQSPMSTTPTPPPSIEPEVIPTREKPTKSYSFKNGDLNLNMTAAEMKARLSSRKKVDPRKEQLDLKSKYQIIQNM